MLGLCGINHCDRYCERRCKAIGFWKDIYDPVTLGFLDSEFETMEELGYEKVLYWMPMIEPPEESEE